MHLASKILWEIKYGCKKFPATCGRLPAIAGGYKQACFKQNAYAEGLF